MADEGQTKKRTFRKFTFRGVDLDQLLDLKTDELVELFHARSVLSVHVVVEHHSASAETVEASILPGGQAEILIWTLGWCGLGHVAASCRQHALLPLHQQAVSLGWPGARSCCHTAAGRAGNSSVASSASP